MMSGFNGWFWVAVTALILNGCTANPITGRNQLSLVSEQAAIARAAPAYTNLVAHLSRRGKIESGTARANKVKEITNRIVAEAVRLRPDSASWRWEVVVINDPSVINAWCAAGGKMAIYTGYWDQLQATDDEIAAVMGHEVSHALAGHSAEKTSMAIAAGIGVAVVAGIAARNSSDPYAFGRYHDLAALVATLGITLPHSRDAETEADQIGIELVARAGFDPAAAVSLWNKIAGRGERRPAEFLSTHPAPENRAQNLQTSLERVNPLYRTAVAARPTKTVLTGRVNTNAENRTVTYASRSVAVPSVMSFTAKSQGHSDSYPDLMTAVMAADTGGIEYFLTRGADINERRNGVTYLIAAILHGNVQVVQFLVSKGADVNKADSRGITPIMYAKAGGPNTLPLTELLEQAGALNPLASR